MREVVEAVKSLQRRNRLCRRNNLLSTTKVSYCHIRYDLVLIFLLLDGIPKPYLRLRDKVKVYGWKLNDRGDGNRERKIFLNGISRHPNVDLVGSTSISMGCTNFYFFDQVTDINEADFILWVTVQNINVMRSGCKIKVAMM